MQSTPQRNTADPPHILLVASNQAGLKARKIVLEEKGYHVTATNKVREATAVLAEGLPRLVIADYNFDHQNGIAFLSSVREAHEVLPLVLLLGPLEEISADLSACCADLIVKKNATELTQLFRGVERLLKRRSPRKSPSSIRAPRARKKKVGE